MSGGKRSRGRPGAVFSKSFTVSRQLYVCPICKTNKRSDKLAVHIKRLCHFDSTGNALYPGSEEFKKLQKEAKVHTRHCFENKIIKRVTDTWKSLVPAAKTEDEEDTSLFKKRKKDDKRSTAGRW